MTNWVGTKISIETRRAYASRSRVDNTGGVVHALTTIRVLCVCGGKRESPKMSLLVQNEPALKEFNSFERNLV